MGKIIYLIAGVIFEASVIRSYIKNKVPYSKTIIIVGGIIDIIIWPIMLLDNIREWSR